MASSMDELSAFYDAFFPRLEEAIELLRPVPARRPSRRRRANLLQLDPLPRHGGDGRRDLRPAQDRRLPPTPSCTASGSRCRDRDRRSRSRWLSETVGAEVLGVDAEQLVDDDALAAALLDALEANGVLVFRGLHLDPRRRSRSAASSARSTCSDGHHPMSPASTAVSLDPTKNRARPTTSTARSHWHIDGCTPDGDECPQMATVLIGQGRRRGRRRDRVRQHLRGLRRPRRRREGAPRVRCGSCTRSRRRSGWSTPIRRRSSWRRGAAARPRSTRWCGRTAAAAARSCSARRPTTSSAWTPTRAGRCSTTCSPVPPRPERVYRHAWSVGDTVIWDNRGVLHRAAPYDPDSPREMFRTTVLGDEPIQ